MMTVALTGNVASGKSTVARIWSEAGLPVVLADDLARQVVEPGSEGLAEVVAAFGREILDSEGSLDRERLRDVVFRDTVERERLEAILHPRIGALRDEWMAGRKDSGDLLSAAEIPLLFEAGLEEDFDAVVLVDAPEEERLRRMRADRGLEDEEALRIMAAQIPAVEKRARSHFVLENDGTRAELEIRALALLDLLRARARREGRV